MIIIDRIKTTILLPRWKEYLDIKFGKRELMYIILFILLLPKVSPGQTLSVGKLLSLIKSPSSTISTKTKQCNRNFDVLWPTDPPGPTLVLGFLMTMKGSVTERLGLKIPGMLSKSVEDINYSGVLPQNYTLQIQIRDTFGDEVTSTKHVTEMVCQNISAFIGPEHTCWVEATIAEARNLPMISYACGDKRASKRKTFSRTNPSEKHLLQATVRTLQHFNWTRFSIVYGTDMEVMAHSLENLAIEQNLIVNHKELFTSESEFPSVFLNTMNRTRVYVLLGHRTVVPRALLAMTFRGLFNPNKKEYILIYVETEEFFQRDWATYLFRAETIIDLKKSNNSLEGDLDIYERSFMIVGNTLPNNVKKMEDITRTYNKRPPFCLTSAVRMALIRGLTGGKPLPVTTQHVPFLTSSYLYDAVQLYAEAVREIYDEQLIANNNNTALVNVAEIGRNGTAIAQKLTNKTFQSILGYQVTMGENRESEGRYSVYYFTKSDECNQSQHLSEFEFRSSSHCLIKLSDFEKNKPLNTTIVIDIQAVPRCGYENDCGDSATEPRKIVLIILMTSVVLLSFISVQKYRHWKYEQEISGLQWRIEKKELTEIYHAPLSNSRCSLASCISQDMNTQMFYNPVADYRGAYVCLKDIYLRRQELSREIMKRMRSMREFKHRNVCSFIGAFVEVGRLTLVTEYLSRGSLEDILENDDIKLDKLFISSLVQDLLRAMVFLHANFGAHGNLKSPNCVVTGRWVLQVTDYDLQDLRCEEYMNLTDEDITYLTPEGKKYLKRQLWRSPEILNQEPEAVVTKESDVYAFGIILHEIIARKGPFSTSEADSPSFITIIEDVKKGYMASGLLRRPNLDDLHDMPFGSDREVVDAMKMAWLEETDRRPDFKTLMVKLKKLKKSGNIMDHMVTLLEEHNKNLEGLVHSKTQELRDEKRRTEDLLHRMLPPSVVVCLLSNMYVEPQSYDAVTIYFSDIVGFTSLSAESTPYEVVSFLNDLYLEFDTIISCYDVYKIETIGDAYMVVSGLPKRNQGRHSGEIASMALALLEKTKTFQIKHKPDQTLKLRIGLHTGPVVAGVVGRTMPRYCLFGDTVNTASRMESTGEPLRIHVSQQFKNALDILGGYTLKERGLTQMKGKGSLVTYWLVAAEESAIQPREQPDLPMPFFQRFDEFDQERFRRRSPRLTNENRQIGCSCDSKTPTPSLTGKSIEADEYGGLHRENSPVRNEHVRPGILLPTHQWRRLSSSLRANSVECAAKSGLLAPPKSSDNQSDIPSRAPSNGSVRESHSLDRFPSVMHLEVPNVTTIKACSTSPSSSDPSLPYEEVLKVNFSLSSKVRDEDGNDVPAELESEFEPMLKATTFEDESTPDEKIDSFVNTNRMKSFLFSLRTKNKKENVNSSCKLPLNGLQTESHV